MERVRSGTLAQDPERVLWIATCDGGRRFSRSALGSKTRPSLAGLKRFQPQPLAWMNSGALVCLALALVLAGRSQAFVPGTASIGLRARASPARAAMASAADDIRKVHIKGERMGGVSWQARAEFGARTGLEPPCGRGGARADARRRLPSPGVVGGEDRGRRWRYHQGESVGAGCAACVSAAAAPGAVT